MFKTKVMLLLCFILPGLASAVDFTSSAYLTPQSEIFVSGMQRFVTMKNKKNDSVDRFEKTKFSPTAVALGYKFGNDTWTAGLSASYEVGNLKYYNYGFDEFAKIRDETWGFTLFGEYRFCDGWYVNGSTMVGLASQKVKGGYVGTDAYGSRGKANSTRYAASLEVGKRLDLGNSFVITPHAGFDYAHIPGKDIPYTVGGFADDSPWESQNYYEIPVGVAFAKTYAAGCDWFITPSLDLTFVSSLGNMKERSMNNRPGFASRTGSEWKVYGIGASHWGGRVTAGVQAIKANRFDLGVNYAYEGRKKYHDHRITADVGLAF
ncbi:MAG: autotransporter outer membrane beta-barrel domain-containing protein [Planctomycetes bacterium]|nr:autotransporter outer membrane beta-barrel domain-containing protein [Planctomycetota bacterium]